MSVHHTSESCLHGSRYRNNLCFATDDVSIFSNLENPNECAKERFLPFNGKKFLRIIIDILKTVQDRMLVLFTNRYQITN